MTVALLELTTDPIVWHAVGHVAGESAAALDSGSSIRVYSLRDGSHIAEVASSPARRFGQGSALTFCEVASEPALVVGTEHTITVNHLPTGEVVKVIADAPTLVFDVCAGVIEGCPILACGGGDRCVHIWELESGRRFCEPLRGHVDDVTRVQFVCRGDEVLLCSSSSDGCVRLWDLSRRASTGVLLSLHTGSGDVLTTRSDDLDPWMAHGVGSRAFIWSLTTLRPISPPALWGSGNKLLALGFAPTLHDVTPLIGVDADGMAHVDDGVRVWSLELGVVPREARIIFDGDVFVLAAVDRGMIAARLPASFLDERLRAYTR